LIARWRALADALSESGSWTGAQRVEAARLWGEPDAARADVVRAHDAMARPETDRDAAARDRDRLCTAIARVVEDLTARAARLWEAIDGPTRAEAPERALVLLTPQAGLLLRYERAHELDYHRALDKLMKLRQSPADEATEDAVENKDEVESGPTQRAVDVTLPNEPNLAAEPAQFAEKTVTSVEASGVIPTPVGVLDVAVGRAAPEASTEAAAEVTTSEPPRAEPAEVFRLPVETCAPWRPSRANGEVCCPSASVA
jgi:hypothetical protein